MMEMLDRMYSCKMYLFILSFSLPSEKNMMTMVSKLDSKLELCKKRLWNYLNNIKNNNNNNNEDKKF